MKETKRQPDTVLDAYSVQKAIISDNNPVIFDVGAFVGQVTGRYRQLFPYATIHSFEPFPFAFRELHKNTSHDPGIKVHNTAISGECGTVTFNSNTYAPTNSLLKTDEKGKSYWGDGILDTKDEITVSTTTIDRFCNEQNISKIDILKLDIQGAEYQAFTGAEEMLSSQSISIIYTELILVPTYLGQRKFHEYLQLLDSFGYVLFSMFNPMMNKLQLNQIDILFVSEKHLKSANINRPA